MAQRITNETFYMVCIQSLECRVCLHDSTSQLGLGTFRGSLGTRGQPAAGLRDKVAFSSCKQVVPFIKTNRKLLEGIILCLRDTASAVGTFVFVHSFTRPTVPVRAAVISSHKAQMGLFCL